MVRTWVAHPLSPAMRTGLSRCYTRPITSPVRQRHRTEDALERHSIGLSRTSASTIRPASTTTRAMTACTLRCGGTAAPSLSMATTSAMHASISRPSCLPDAITSVLPIPLSSLMTSAISSPPTRFFPPATSPSRPSLSSRSAWLPATAASGASSSRSKSPPMSIWASRPTSATPTLPTSVSRPSSCSTTARSPMASCRSLLLPSSSS